MMVIRFALADCYYASLPDSLPLLQVVHAIHEWIGDPIDVVKSATVGFKQRVYCDITYVCYTGLLRLGDAMELAIWTMVVSVLVVLAFGLVVSRPVSNMAVARLSMDVRVEAVLARHRRVTDLPNQDGRFQRIDILRAYLAMLKPSLGETRAPLVRSIKASQQH